MTAAMSETLPYAEKALKIETSGMNITHVGSVVEGMMLDMEYEEVKFNLHQDRNVYFPSQARTKRSCWPASRRRASRCPSATASSRPTPTVRKRNPHPTHPSPPLPTPLLSLPPPPALHPYC